MLQNSGLMNYENITLIAFGLPDQELLKAVAGDISGSFPLPLLLKSGYLDLSEFYDPARRQYNGNSILKKLDDDYSHDSSKTMGLFAVDLYIPILTYIFGQAHLNGNTGIVSIYRLTNERYGIGKNGRLLAGRLGKEIIHELGHMFGLIHCSDPVCVMRSSTYVEDIDQKESRFCKACRTIINARL